jgi:protein farnesyltransferase subunit beta
MQQTPEGGFAGRTNKLVDACYSWWIGGCWSLIEAVYSHPVTSPSLWNRGTPLPCPQLNSDALKKYVLSCAQAPDGGLRDKPGMRPDFYHSLYSLAGLSATQYRYVFDEMVQPVDGEDQVPFKWVVTGEMHGEESDRVAQIHPLFVLPWGDAERIKNWFVRKDNEGEGK